MFSITCGLFTKSHIFLRLFKGLEQQQVTKNNSWLTGPFRCNVSNPVSTVTSDPVNLSISCELLKKTEFNILLHFSSTQRNFSMSPLHLDGPENLILSPPQGYFAVGSDISLTCSVGSIPPAQFNWFLNGDHLPDTGSELRLMDVQMSQSGNYSCQAFNSKTLRSETSEPSAITVLDWL
uniref:Ig-like domain-containing protein n=1 Tax=Haplochromis burtoni TaxID=8153 RepID=A0A3Q2W359_HAPBU